VKNYSRLVKSYSRQARGYDRRWLHYNRETLRATLETIPWGHLARILDVSCGTGLLEEAVRRLHPDTKVVGIDISPAMLEEARRKLAGAERVMLVNGAAEVLPFAAGSFDAVICANSLHYYREPMQALSEFHRVVHADGWVVVVDWCHDYLSCKIFGLVLPVVDRAYYRMYGMEQCREMLTQAGFQVEFARRFKIDWLWGLMAQRAHA